MALAPGTRFGAYDVLGLVGTGGMGEVYKARDPRLNRFLALKIIPDELAADERRRERFRREAQAIAALTHPNIVTIYGAEEIDGRLVLAMELVDGKTLADLIPKGGLPLDRQLKLAVQMAEALGAAHDRGIVHRDFKPRNVMVAEDGRVKVLDFGLATLRDLQPAPGTNVTAPLWELTGEGRVVGTASYMSPEQAEGHALDYRTDLFSLGIVLHEMAVGERPFQGDSIVSVLAAIVRDTPRPLTEINPRIPKELGRIVRRCLAKDREERYQSARDLGHDLTDLRLELRSGESGERQALPAGMQRGYRLMAGIAGGLLLAGAAGWAAGRFSGPTAVAAARPAESLQLTFEPGMESSPSISPDGRWVVYTRRADAKTDVFLQAVGGDRSINLTGESNSGNGHPAFSPDGERIAFRSSRQGGGLFVMGRTGDFVRRVSDAGYSPTWSPDGKRLAYSSMNVTDFPYAHVGGSTLWTVEIETGERRQLSTGDAVQPAWSPNGSRIAYWGVDAATRRRDIWTVATGGGAPVAVTGDVALDATPVWAPDGRHLYFASDRGGTINLWRVPIDESSGRVLGPAEPVTVPAGQAFWPTLSRDGRRLAYATTSWIGTVYALAFDPNAGAVAGAPSWLLGGPHHWSTVRVSPDGRRLLVVRWSQQQDFFMLASDGTGLRRLTDDPAGVRCPEWSPDGRRIVFLSAQRGDRVLRFLDPDTGGVERRNDVVSTGLLGCPVWSPDGNRLALQQGPEQAATLIVHASADAGREPLDRLPDHPGGAFVPRAWSANGQVLAGTVGNRIAIYNFDLRRYDTLADGPPVIAAARLQWLPDGKRLLAQGQRTNIYLVDAGSHRFTEAFSTAPDLVRTFSLTLDGRRLYISRGPEEGDVWVTTLR